MKLGRGLWSPDSGEEVQDHNLDHRLEVTEPKKEVLSKARKTNSTSTLGTSANTWLVKRKTAKGKLVRRELLKKFMLVNSVRSQHSDDY